MLAWRQGMSDKEMEDLAAYFASLPARPRRATADARRGAVRGRRGAGGQRTLRHLPPAGASRARAQMPRLTGQREDSLAHALTQYRDGRRMGRTRR